MGENRESDFVVLNFFFLFRKEVDQRLIDSVSQGNFFLEKESNKNSKW